MSLGRINSPGENTGPHFTENISLVVCPFLGMDEDPGTSLGYPHSANLCHRLEQPVGIDLAHQNRYCLCNNYLRCYVYGQPQAQTQPARVTKKGASLPAQTADDPELLLNKQPPNRRGVRAFGLLVMLLLILLAAIIWWPPPGTSIQEFVVQGAAVVKETAGSEDVSSELNALSGEKEAPLESAAALDDESTVLAMKAVDSASTDQNASVESSKSDTVEEAQAKTAGAKLTASENIVTAPGENLSAGERDLEDGPEFDNSETEYEMVVPETAVADEEDSALEALAETVGEEINAQASTRQSIVQEQSAEVGTEEVGGQEANIVSAPEADNPEPASVESKTPDLPAAVTTTYIGPIANAAGLQDTSEPPPLLFLLRHPGDGAEVLAMIPERQPVTVLGRNSSGEWLLVRLASGVEGWVHSRESGASIIVSNLPITEHVSGNASNVQGQDQVAAPAAENQSPAAEAGASSIFGTAVINSGALNLRSGPGLEYDPIGMAYNGQQVSLLEPLDNNVWVQVGLADGKQGWVNSNYLIQITWFEG